MSNLLDTQVSESNLPILCIFGGTEFLQHKIVLENSKKFRIVLLSSKKPDFLEDFPQVYFVSYQNSALLPKLQETFNYSIIFLSLTTQKYASPFLEKIRSDKTQTLLVVDVDFLKSQLSIIKEFISIPNLRLALLGEILESSIVGETRGLTKIIESAILNGEIRLMGNESFPVYGVSLSDFLIGVSRLLFGNFKNDNLYFLFYKHPETILESAHLINRVEPDVKIHFSDSAVLNGTITRHEISNISQKLGLEETYLLESASSFENAMKHNFANREKILEDMAGKLKRKKSKKKSNEKFSKIAGFTIASVFFGTFLFLFVNLILLGASILLLQDSIKSLKNGNFQQASYSTRTANFFLSTIHPTADLSFELIGLLDHEKKMQQMFMVARRASELSELAGNTVLSLTKNTTLTKNSLGSVVSNFSFLFQEGQRIAIETENTDLSSQLKSTYSKLLSFSEVLPIIFGFDSPKNYLLLFQNDEELRPTGGFIGSIGELDVNDGKVSQLSVQDVYELDGQLKNHIEPHYIIRRYLQPHLYLRDSNFSLNFQDSASMAALLYNLETSKRPDAVIAVNLEVLRQILKMTGPIELRSYNVTVTEDTVSQFLQSTIKENFFPGSTQKKDVLNALLTELIARSEQDPKFNGKVIQLLPDLLEKKHILISFSDNSLQKLFLANRYGGEHMVPLDTDSRTINDYLYINEANIGVNKVNAFITRKVSYNAMVGQGKLSSKATLTLTNASSTDSYKVFLRFAVPKGSSLTQITINGIQQRTVPAITDFKVYEATNFSPPTELEVEQYQEHNLSIFAFIVDAKNKDKTVVEVAYENGAVKALQSIATYSFNFIKQPGTKSYELITSVDYPEGYTPVDTSADSYGKNFLEETTKIEKDYSVQIELQRKQQ